MKEDTEMDKREVIKGKIMNNKTILDDSEWRRRDLGEGGVAVAYVTCAECGT
jgi:hypothetical protein